MGIELDKLRKDIMYCKNSIDYIDNLKITSLINSVETQTSTILTTLSFQIFEPYGFSFLSRLKDAAYSVSKTSKLPGIEKAGHHLQQRYMIGIKFYGYDEIIPFD